MSFLAALLALAPSVALPWAKPLEAENKRLKAELAEMREQLLDLAIRMERVRSECNEWRTRYELMLIPPRQLTPQEMYEQTQNEMLRYAQAQNAMQGQQHQQAAQAQQNLYQGLQGFAQAPDWVEHFCNCTPSRAHGLLGVIPGG
jgi:chromosome condensin MukBEF ATPase and DNA-binding subunit MukB